MSQEGICACSEGDEGHFQQFEQLTIRRIILAAVDWREKIYGVPG